MPIPLLGRLESAPDGQLLIQLTDGQTLRVSSEQIHGPVMPNAPLRLFIVSQSPDGIGDQALSQAMLNELLTPPSP